MCRRKKNQKRGDFIIKWSHWLHYTNADVLHIQHCSVVLDGAEIAAHALFSYFSFCARELHLRQQTYWHVWNWKNSARFVSATFLIISLGNGLARVRFYRQKRRRTHYLYRLTWVLSATLINQRDCHLTARFQWLSVLTKCRKVRDGNPAYAAHLKTIQR